MTVVAIGTFRNVGEWEATFVVEDGIKGVVDGDELPFDNRHPGLGADCSTYHDNAMGNRFAEGDRVLLLLEEQVDGLWQIGLSGMGAYPVPPDDLAPLVADRMPGQSLLTMDEVRERVRDAQAVPAAEFAATENALGCQPPMIFYPAELETYAGLATAVAIVETAPGEFPPPDGVAGAQPATVREVLRGELPAGEITLNSAWISDYHTGDCVPAVETGTAIRPGTTYLMFLIPDEFGIGEYRSVAWNQSAVEVNERYVVGWYSLTLGAIRDAAGQVRQPEQEETPGPAAVSGEATVVQDDSGETLTLPSDGESGEGLPADVLAAAAAGLALAVVAAVFVLRQRRTG